MSHFSKIETTITDQAALLLALADVGFGPEKVELHSVAQPLYGYQGDKRKERAEVIIRRKEVGSVSNDIGFALGPQGTYEAIISEYDSTRYNQGWLDRVSQRYAYHQTVSTLALQGFMLQEETNENGEIHLSLMRYA